jgi:hypothetical protein
MTVVVAFYGSPAGVSDAANSQLAASASPHSGSSTGTGFDTPAQAVMTSRAQIALARWPLSAHATSLAVFGLTLVAGFWIGRHALGLRRAFVQGESFIFSHPLMDVGLLLVGLALFALTRTAGLVR